MDIYLNNNMILEYKSVNIICYEVTILHQMDLTLPDVVSATAAAFFNSVLIIIKTFIDYVLVTIIF